MKHSRELRRCLLEADVQGARKLWAETQPQLPQPASDAEAEIMLHHARTCMESIPLRPRAYSHRWLVERSLPSALPDELKSRAERMYPVIAEGVGIAVLGRGVYAPISKLVQAAMAEAVVECYADGQRETEFVKARMQEARHRVVRDLLGIRHG